MVISDIITEFGAYYLKNGQNAARIYNLLRANTKTSELLTPIVTDETIWRAAKAAMTRVLQPFQKAFTPLDALTITPEEIRMFKMKVDIAEYPDDLEASWLGFLAANSVNRAEWPFVRWYVEQHLIPQAKEDEELLEIFWGVYAAPTPGTAGASGTSMNGLNKIILDHISDARITPITTGALEATPSAFVDQVEDFADQINKKYWGTSMSLAMSESNARKYQRGYDVKYGSRTNQTGKNDTEVSKTNLTVVGLPSMIGSDGIWTTPKANAIKLLKKSENMDNFKVENVDRQVKLYTDWYTGVGFILPEAVFVNDQFSAGS